MNKTSGIKLTVVIVVIAAALIFSIKPLAENINLGLDLQGGAEVVLQAVPDEGQEVTAADMEQLVSVLDNRVNELGVSEPIIQAEGNDRLIVQLAGVDDPDQAIEIIGKTAQLEFVDPLGNVILTGAELEDAYAQIDNTKSANERNQVAFKLNEKGREAFFNATTQYVGQVISITLDGEVISSPVVETPISEGEGVISGGFSTFEEASDLAALLRGGALPVDLEILSQRTVGPTLGADSLDKSIQAMGIGFIILFAFMIIYYRVPGIWACISLVVYSLILLSLIHISEPTRH